MIDKNVTQQNDLLWNVRLVRVMKASYFDNEKSLKIN